MYSLKQCSSFVLVNLSHIDCSTLYWNTE